MLIKLARSLKYQQRPLRIYANYTFFFQIWLHVHSANCARKQKFSEQHLKAALSDTVALMRAVRSLIQNQRHFTATRPGLSAQRALRRLRNTAPPPAHTATHTQSWHFQRTHRFVVRFLTVCRETPSVAVTAVIRPPVCALREPHTNLLRPHWARCSNDKRASVIGSHLAQSHRGHELSDKNTTQSPSSKPGKAPRRH